MRHTLMKAIRRGYFCDCQAHSSATASAPTATQSSGRVFANAAPMLSHHPSMSQGTTSRDAAGGHVWPIRVSTPEVGGDVRWERGGYRRGRWVCASPSQHCSILEAAACRAAGYGKRGQRRSKKSWAGTLDALGSWCQHAAVLGNERWGPQPKTERGRMPVFLHHVGLPSESSAVILLSLRGALPPPRFGARLSATALCIALPLQWFAT